MSSQGPSSTKSPLFSDKNSILQHFTNDSHKIWNKRLKQSIEKIFWLLNKSRKSKRTSIPNVFARGETLKKKNRLKSIFRT